MNAGENGRVKTATSGDGVPGWEKGKKSEGDGDGDGDGNLQGLER